MRHSDIFNNYIKIAQEQGMISADAPEKAKKKLEDNPRADSLDISAIEALYGVKPDAPKSMQYQKNIMEVAHPKSVVVAPSYDKINGLVENEIERQNISLNIVNKNNDGQLFQYKYAQQQLLLSLVRIANDLDNHKQDQLRVLADTCLSQTHEQITKIALEPISTTVLAVAAILGALYVQQHMSFVNEGFETNYQKLAAELEDLSSDQSEWGVGYTYSSSFKSVLQEFKNRLSAFYNLYQKILPIIDDLEKPRDGKELLQLSQKPETKSVIQAYHAFRTAADNMLPYVNAIEKNFTSENFKNKQIEEKGLLTSLVDRTQFLHGGKGLIADDFEDVARAIPPFKKSIADILDVLKKAESLEKMAQEQLQQASSESQREFGQESSSRPTDVDTEIADLEKELVGGLA